MPDSLTRTSTTSHRAVLYSYDSSFGLPVQEAVVNFFGNNSVTFTPYGHDRWRQTIRSGNEVTSRIDAVSYDITDVEFDYKYVDVVVDAHGVFFGKGYGGVKGSSLVYAVNPGANSTSIANADNQALTELASRIAQAQSTFSGGVALGELRETIGMISHPARSIWGGISQYLASSKKATRGISARNISKKIDVVSDLWLEYSFGWKPLVSDIKDGAKALSELRNGRLPRKTVGASGSDSSNDSSSSGVDNVGSSQIHWRRNISSKSQVRYRCLVSVKTPEDSGATSAILGLNFPSFVPTVWELIPYSFLVDYFTNIGGIIQAASNPSAGVNWTVRGSLTATTCKVDVEKVDIAPSGNPAATRSMLSQKPGIGGSVSGQTKVRESYQGSLVPGLQFKVPGVSSLRWLNIAALGVTHRATIRDIFS